MKKTILTTMMFLVLANANANDVKYKCNFNTNAISRVLSLDKEQTELLSVYNDILKETTNFISESDCTEKQKNILMLNTLNDNLRLLRSVLDKEQYHKYIKMLNITMNNRGISLAEEMSKK